MKRTFPLKPTVPLLLFLFVGMAAHSQTIKGSVSDAATGEPLPGATVLLEHTRYHTTVNLDGSYTFRNVTAGKYEVVVENVGYKKKEHLYVTVEVAGGEYRVPEVKLETEQHDLAFVTIHSSSHGNADKQVLKMEKNADNVLNILSSKTIQLLPDVTVANALQRMSGVTIERSSSGEGRYAIIRGMDQRYNSTLINGVKIPSPDDKFRYVPMDIFPSDLLERLEVMKSLTPSMEGDAIGGTMNLVMKDAPQTFLLQANAAGGYNTLFTGDRHFQQFNHGAINQQSPGERFGPDYLATAADFPKGNLNFSQKNSPINKMLGLTIGNRFFDKRLGVIVAASYQDMFRGSNSDFFFPNSQPDLNSKPQFGDILLRQYSTRNQRLGLHNKIDFLVNNRNKLSLYNLYVRSNEYQSRFTIDSSLSIQRTGPGSGNVSLSQRSRWQQQSIYNSTLVGEHILGKRFHFDWKGVYSIAKNAVPDQAEFSTVHYYGVGQAQGGKDSVTTTNLAGMSRKWLHNSDKDLAGYLNLFFTPTIAHQAVELSTGGLYRHKKRENYYTEYNLSPVIDNNTPQAYTNINEARYAFTTADQGKSNSDQSSNTYTATEHISAGYVQAKFNLLQHLQVIGGARVEHTRQEYYTQQLASLDGKFGTITYTDLLPSINLKYALTQKQNLRLSYYKAVSRPGFGDFVPTQYTGDENYIEGGNPLVKHTQSHNYDARYELFPGGANQLLAGVFYKKIVNPIEYAVTTKGTGSQYLRPDNFGNANNFGFEAVFTHYFGKFGISANYTFTHSRITTSKRLYYYDSTLGQRTTISVQQTRPLQGQSNHIGNLSLLYKDPSIGLDVQVAFVYTGERIAQVSPYLNQDYWQRPYNQLDLSLEKTLGKHFSFYAKINNLTNSIRKLVIKQPNVFLTGRDRLPDQEYTNQVLVQRDTYQINLLGGFRYKF